MKVVELISEMSKMGINCTNMRELIYYEKFILCIHVSPMLYFMRHSAKAYSGNTALFKQIYNYYSYN